MFWFKRKEIVLDCFTSNKSAYDFSQIQPSANYYPNWFHTMESKVDFGTHETSTLKKCEAFLNYYRNGFIMPMWSDLGISIEGMNYKWDFADYKSIAQVHPADQWSNFINPTEYGHLKILTPWHIKCNKEINFMFKRPYWNYNPFDADINIVEGILNFKYQNASNINLFLKINQNKKLLIKFNDPLIYLLPLSEHSIKIKSHLISEKEFYEIVPDLTFMNNYRIKKKILKEKEKKCPFLFNDSH